MGFDNTCSSAQYKGLIKTNFTDNDCKKRIYRTNSTVVFSVEALKYAVNVRQHSTALNQSLHA